MRGGLAYSIIRSTRLSHNNIPTRKNVNRLLWVWLPTDIKQFPLELNLLLSHVSRWHTENWTRRIGNEIGRPLSQLQGWIQAGIFVIVRIEYKLRVARNIRIARFRNWTFFINVLLSSSHCKFLETVYLHYCAKS